MGTRGAFAKRAEILLGTVITVRRGDPTNLIQVMLAKGR